MILPLGGHTGLNAGLGDVVTAAVKEGHGRQVRDRAPAERTSPPRRHLHPL
jgi:hypothetical protein